MADKRKPRQGGKPFGVCPVSLHYSIIIFLFFTTMLFMTSYKSNDFSSHIMISIHGMSQSIYIIINFHSVSSVSEQQ
jgi:hypothetical protein